MQPSRPGYKIGSLAERDSHGRRHLLLNLPGWRVMSSTPPPCAMSQKKTLGAGQPSSDQAFHLIPGMAGGWESTSMPKRSHPFTASDSQPADPQY